MAKKPNYSAPKTTPKPSKGPTLAQGRGKGGKLKNINK